MLDYQIKFQSKNSKPENLEFSIKGENKTYKNLKEIIIHVLKFKLNSYSEEQKNYKILIKTLKELKDNNQI